MTQEISLLIVDDEISIVSSLTDSLRSYATILKDEIVVYTATTVLDALNLLHCNVIDCVFLDYHFEAGMNGLELIERLVDPYESTFFVLMSGYSDEEALGSVIFRCRQRFGYRIDFIRKPITPLEIQDKFLKIKDFCSSRPYPRPLAYLNDALKSCSSEQDTLSVLQALVSSIIRYSVFIIVADRLKSNRNIEQLDYEFLGQTNQEYLDLLSLLVENSPLNDFMPELQQFWSDKKNLTLLNSFNNDMENTGTISGMYFDRLIADEYLSKYQKPIIELVSGLQFMSRYPLIVPTRSEFSETHRFGYQLHVLMGNSLNLKVIQIKTRQQLALKSLLVTDQKDRFLTLEPYITYKVCSKCRRSTIFFLNKTNLTTQYYYSYLCNHSITVQIADKENDKGKEEGGEMGGKKKYQLSLAPSASDTRKTIKFKLQLGRLLDLEFETRVIDSPMGQPVGSGKSPYTQEQLVAVLKALQASQYQEQNFTPMQRDDLKQLGLLTNPHFVPNLQQRIGEMLFRGLVADQKVHTAFQVTTTQARTNDEIVAFQLRFDEDVTELARYPWELLHDGRRALLPSGVIELTRYISYPEATTRLSAPAPLRLLYITSRPNNLPELSPDTERQATREPLQPLENDGQLHIDDLPRATYNALVDYLDTYKPHILHFDGHGRFHRQCHVCRTFYYPHITQCENCTAPLPDPQGYLAFEQEDGGVDWIGSETLGHLFNSNLRLAVLSACSSGTVRGESLFGGVGPALIQAGVPAVVATQLPISVDAAREFAKGFYRALARYESLAKAVNAGRRRLFTTKEWFIPVLYLRSQDDEGQLFIQP